MVGNLRGHDRDDREAGSMSTPATLQRWICESCGFIYDPEEGDPDGGIPPGTPFEEIPDTWFCPVCGARKREFSLLED
jgi:rubredoxin